METLATQEIRHFNHHFSYLTPEVHPIPKPLPPVTQFIIDQLLATQYFTKASIAKELQVSIVTINRWASGRIKRPTHKTFSRLLSLYCAVRGTHVTDIQEREAAVA